ncbi:Uncharacterised protein [Chromobacterium violaceum]|uniref:Uncharacterized protein n=1 Tax=Chromobacterium violaceum TaxID=536 RepID=A0A3S4HFH2_CHRVL|nr:Uncharacterised protein [Chromobacterium violaceum]
MIADMPDRRLLVFAADIIDIDVESFRSGLAQGLGQVLAVVVNGKIIV